MQNMQKIRQNAQTVAGGVPDFASILIVDDQRFDRARLRRMCKDLDFEVKISEADSLESTGTALELDTFDLIFLDFHLCDGNGLQALDAIRYHPSNRNAATIMVTGSEEQDVVVDSMKSGCSDFLSKDSLTHDLVRRSVLNALKQSGLNSAPESQQVLRSKVDAVLESFAKECVSELKPVLFNIMRHVRDLNSIREDEVKHRETLQKIANCCNWLFDFMSDVDDRERKDFALMDLGAALDEPVEVLRAVKRADKPRLFGRQPHKPN